MNGPSSPRVSGLAPDGTPITLPEAKVGELQDAGGRVQSREEGAQAQARIDRSLKEDRPFKLGDLPKTSLAGVHSFERGKLEAFGVPLDKGIVGIAGLFGDDTKKSTRDYLKSLDDENHALTTVTGLEGNVGGAIAAAEVSGARAGLGAMRGLGGFAARAGASGVENVLQATTHDINEAALGDHAVNGDKLVAAAPGRFLMAPAMRSGRATGRSQSVPRRRSTKLRPEP